MPRLARLPRTRPPPPCCTQRQEVEAARDGVRQAYQAAARATAAAEGEQGEAQEVGEEPEGEAEPAPAAEFNLDALLRDKCSYHEAADVHAEVQRLIPLFAQGGPLRLRCGLREPRCVGLLSEAAGQGVAAWPAASLLSRAACCHR